MTPRLYILAGAALSWLSYFMGYSRGLKRGEALALKSINRFGQAQRAPRG